MATEIYKQLQEHIDNGDYEAIIEASNEILKKTPDDKKVIACKSAALIHDGQFEAALEFVRKNSSNIENAKYQEAYCLYRLEKLDESINVLSTMEDNPAKLQLLGQIYYKKEEYGKSAEYYEKLIHEHNVADEETLTNLTAAYVLDEQYQKVLDISKNKKVESEHFELLYNIGCAFHGVHDYENALKYLKEAEEMCRKNAEEEEYTPEELENELAIILVQQAFVKSSLGEKEEAKEIYSNLLKKKTTDTVSMAVAGNNLTALKGDQDLFDAAKRLKFASSEKVASKLIAKQRRGIHLNNALLLMFMNKFDECMKVATNLQEQFSDSDVPPLVIAALQYREHKYEEAFRTLKQFMEKYPQKSTRVKLTLAQMNLNKGNVKETIQILENISIRDEPAIVGALASLYLRLQQLDGAIQVIDKTCNHLKEKFNEGDESVFDKLIILLHESASLKMRNEKYEDAAKTYEELVKLDPENKEHLAGLVRALSYFDIERAENFAKQLPEIEIDDVNVDQLTSKNVSEITKSKRSLDIDIGEEEEVDEGMKKKKKRKKKKKKLTPEMKEGLKKLDPERWLPKKLRSSYKKKKAKFSQGSVSEKEAQSLQHKSGQKAKVLKPEEVLGKKLQKKKGKKKRK